MPPWSQAICSFGLLSPTIYPDTVGRQHWFKDQKPLNLAIDRKSPDTIFRKMVYRHPLPRCLCRQSLNDTHLCDQCAHAKYVTSTRKWEVHRGIKHSRYIRADLSKDSSMWARDMRSHPSKRGIFVGKDFTYTMSKFRGSFASMDWWNAYPRNVKWMYARSMRRWTTCCCLFHDVVDLKASCPYDTNLSSPSNVIPMTYMIYCSAVHAKRTVLKSPRLQFCESHTAFTPSISIHSQCRNPRYFSSAFRLPLSLYVVNPGWLLKGGIWPNITINNKIK